MSAGAESDTQYIERHLAEGMSVHGPMHGERSKRYQRIIGGSHHCQSTPVIWTQYEIPDRRADEPSGAAQLQVEVQPWGSSPVVLRPTLGQAREIIAGLQDYVDNWKETR